MKVALIVVAAVWLATTFTAVGFVVAGDLAVFGALGAASLLLAVAVHALAKRFVRQETAAPTGYVERERVGW